MVDNFLIKKWIKLSTEKVWLSRLVLDRFQVLETEKGGRTGAPVGAFAIARVLQKVNVLEIAGGKLGAIRRIAQYDGEKDLERER
mgnify:CR=1 FL=1